MNIDTIVYLTQSPFSKRDYERFGIDVFLKHNIRVKVMDLSWYLYKGIPEKESNIEFNCVEEFADFNEIIRKISNFPTNTVFISLIGESSTRALRLINYLSKVKRIFGTIKGSSLPGLNGQKRLIHKIPLSFKETKRMIGKLLYKIIYPNLKYSFIYVNSDSALKQVASLDQTITMLIKGHSLDYDLFLQNKTNVGKMEDSYIVFLDEFLPFHPDYKNLGIDYSHFADNYYNKLNVFFSDIEKKFGLRVVIAAHPRARYDTLPDYWNGRTCISGETINLVKNAKFAILHASTSLNFCILNNTPVMFLTMNEIEKTNIKSVMDAMAQELLINIFNIDTCIVKEDMDEYITNKFKYDDYKNKYIKVKGSEEMNSWEIIYKYLSYLK